MKLWKCSVCGYIHEGEGAPEECPKCGASKEKFAQLSEEDANKIYMSDRTNDIHMEVITLAKRIIALCDEGIELDLDPGCVSDFKKAKKAAWTMKQRSKAEIATHLSRGKW